MRIEYDLAERGAAEYLLQTFEHLMFVSCVHTNEKATLVIDSEWRVAHDRKGIHNARSRLTKLCSKVCTTIL